MARPDTFWTYIMASGSGVVYVGVSSDLASRVMQHKSKLIPGFTQKYNVTKLVWFEAHSSVRAAISREKEIKGWGRIKKAKLIEEHNPMWKDLSQGKGLTRHLLWQASPAIPIRNTHPRHSERSPRSEESLFD